MSQTDLTTNNPDWGFWGTVAHRTDPAEAWPLAMRAIAGATGFEQDAVRSFLDSRHGRHFADDVADGLHAGRPLADAVDAAVERWMGWRIGRRLERLQGIPHDLPYLTGLVGQYEIEAEADA